MVCERYSSGEIVGFSCAEMGMGALILSAGKWCISLLELVQLEEKCVQDRCAKSMETSTISHPQTIVSAGWKMHSIFSILLFLIFF